MSASAFAVTVPATAPALAADGKSSAPATASMPPDPTWMTLRSALMEWKKSGKMENTTEDYKLAQSLEGYLKTQDVKLLGAEEKRRAGELFRSCGVVKLKTDSDYRKYLSLAADCGDMQALYLYLMSFDKTEQLAPPLRGKFYSIILSTSYQLALTVVAHLETLQKEAKDEAKTDIDLMLTSHTAKVLKRNQQLITFNGSQWSKDQLVALAKENNLLALWRLFQLYDRKADDKLRAKLALSIHMLAYAEVDPEQASHRFKLPVKEFKQIGIDARKYLTKGGWQARKRSVNDYAKMAHWGLKLVDALKESKIDIYHATFDFDRHAVAHLQSGTLQVVWYEKSKLNDAKANPSAQEQPNDGDDDIVMVHMGGVDTMLKLEDDSEPHRESAAVSPKVDFENREYIALTGDDLTGKKTVLENYATGLVDGLGYEKGWHKKLSVTEEMKKFTKHVPFSPTGSAAASVGGAGPADGKANGSAVGAGTAPVGTALFGGRGTASQSGGSGSGPDAFPIAPAALAVPAAVAFDGGGLMGGLELDSSSAHGKGLRSG